MPVRLLYNRYFRIRMRFKFPHGIVDGPADEDSSRRSPIMKDLSQRTIDKPVLLTPPEFLDRHSWLPVFLLVFLPILVCIPHWLFGYSIDPVWFVSSMTSAVQPFPGYPFIDPNAGFTSEALGHLAAWDWLHGIVPWWNPYTGVGMPLAGEMQPGAFFLPFNLLLILKEGLLWQRICMQIIAGLGTYALLRELKLSRLASMMSGAVFAFNGTIAWTPGPAAGYCSLPFLPMLLWGIERARNAANGPASILAIGLAIAWSILAGFPETAYISGLLALAWGVYRLLGEQERLGMVLRALTGFFLGLLIAAPLLIAFADYLQESDSFSVHLLGEASLPAAWFAQMMMPYVYGPMPSNFHSLPMDQLWGNTGGYAGSLLILLAVVGIVRRSSHSKLRILLAAWVLVAWAKTLGIQPIQYLVNFIPLLRRAAFFRYADPSWIFALAVLAAFGLDELRAVPLRRRYPFAIAMAMLALAIAVAWPQRAFWERPASLQPLMFLIMCLSLAVVGVEFLVVALAWKHMQTGQCRHVVAALLVIDAMAMFFMPQLSARHHTHVDTAAIQFLHDHQGLSRVYSLGPLSANYGAYFKIASIDHNALPVPKLWTRYVDDHLLPGLLDKSAGVDFTPDTFPEGYGTQAFSKHLANYRDVGVGYIATAVGQSPVPRVFTPAIGKTNPLSPATPSLVERITFMKPAITWCRVTAANANAPAFERSIATTVLKRLTTPQTAARELTPEGNGSGLLFLLPGKKLTISMANLPSIPGSQPINAIALMASEDGEAGDGTLSVEACVEDQCRSGHRLLAEAKAAAYFAVPLESELPVRQHASLQLTLIRQDASSRSVYLKLLPASDAETQQIHTPAGDMAGKALQLGLDYGQPLRGLKHVYSDSLMEIWEMSNPAPYYEVVSGGPCTMQDVRRETVVANCAAPASLMRRELFMPGWTAVVNKKRMVPTRVDDIFQAVGLPAGQSESRFRFVPPHMALGWSASLAGCAGLLAQLFLLLRRERSRI